MIKFFRKIRQGLLSENKFNRYILYAIGEIVLVVIGILIALQINNWNEKRQRKAYEIATLQDIKSDIDANITNIEIGNTFISDAIKKSNQVIIYYKNKVPVEKVDMGVFDVFLTNWDPDFTYASFENLKREGINLISDKSLRKDIVRIFEVDMSILDKSEIGRYLSLYNQLILPTQRKYFYREKSNVATYNDHDHPDFDYTQSVNNIRQLPSNYSRMIQDQEFFNVVTETNYRQQRMLVRNQVFLKNAKDVSDKIDTYIKNQGY